MRACIPEFKFSNTDLEAYRRAVKSPTALAAVKAAWVEVKSWVSLSTQSDKMREAMATKLVFILKNVGLSPQALSEIGKLMPKCEGEVPFEDDTWALAGMRRALRHALEGTAEAALEQVARSVAAKTVRKALEERGLGRELDPTPEQIAAALGQCSPDEMETIQGAFAASGLDGDFARFRVVTPEDFMDASSSSDPSTPPQQNEAVAVAVAAAQKAVDNNLPPEEMAEAQAHFTRVLGEIGINAELVIHPQPPKEEPPTEEEHATGLPMAAQQVSNDHEALAYLKVIDTPASMVEFAMILDILDDLEEGVLVPPSHPAVSAKAKLTSLGVPPRLLQRIGAMMPPAKGEERYRTDTNRSLAAIQIRRAIAHAVDGTAKGSILSYVEKHEQELKRHRSGLAKEALLAAWQAAKMPTPKDEHAAALQRSALNAAYAALGEQIARKHADYNDQSPPKGKSNGSLRTEVRRQAYEWMAANPGKGQPDLFCDGRNVLDQSNDPRNTAEHQYAPAEELLNSKEGAEKLIAETKLAAENEKAEAEAASRGGQESFSSGLEVLQRGKVDAENMEYKMYVAAGAQEFTPGCVETRWKILKETRFTPRLEDVLGRECEIVFPPGPYPMYLPPGYPTENKAVLARLTKDKIKIEPVLVTRVPGTHAMHYGIPENPSETSTAQGPSGAAFEKTPHYNQPKEYQQFMTRERNGWTKETANSVTSELEGNDAIVRGNLAMIAEGFDRIEKMDIEEECAQMRACANNLVKECNTLRVGFHRRCSHELREQVDEAYKRAEAMRQRCQGWLDKREREIQGKKAVAEQQLVAFDAYSALAKEVGHKVAVANGLRDEGKLDDATRVFKTALGMLKAPKFDPNDLSPEYRSTFAHQLSQCEKVVDALQAQRAQAKEEERKARKVANRAAREAEAPPPAASSSSPEPVEEKASPPRSRRDNTAHKRRQRARKREERLIGGLLTDEPPSSPDDDGPKDWMAMVTDVQASMRAATEERAAQEAAELSEAMARSLVDTESELPADTHCVVCFEEVKSHACVPCGHVCLCAVCATNPRVTEICPLCRTPVVQMMKVRF